MKKLLGAAVSAAAMLLAAGTAMAAGELHIYNWGDYTNPELIKKFEKQFDVKVTLDDSNGQEQMILETPGGQTITLKDGPGSIELSDANGNTITMDSSGITITAAAQVKISAGATVQVDAAQMTVNAGMAQFSGVVQCQTLIATSVVGTSYTPGAGNIW